MSGGIPHWVYPNAKIVCVDNTDYDNGGAWDPPVLHAIYTVKSSYSDYANRGPHVVLAEIGGEEGYRISRFRPLHSVKSDAKMFQRIVRKVDNRVTV